jgi:hypothetical protein
MIDIYGNDVLVYPIPLFTVKYKGVVADFVFNRRSNYSCYWESFDSKSLNKTDSSIFEPINNIAYTYCRKIRSQDPEGITYYDWLENLRKEIKQNIPDAAVSELKIDRQYYRMFPDREPVIDDSEILEKM